MAAILNPRWPPASIKGKHREISIIIHKDGRQSKNTVKLAKSMKKIGVGGIERFCFTLMKTKKVVNITIIV
jgi:hypothetical protein